MKTVLRLALVQLAVLAALVAIPSGASAQARVEIVFSTQERAQIRDFFASHHQPGVRPLPPGIRKRLARGKPLPPGIAKQTLPSQLAAVLPTRDGYQHVQVGVDVLLVEVATGIIHDVLMDVIR